MKKYILPSLRLTLVMVLLCSILYPCTLALVARLAPGNGNGRTIRVGGRVAGYANVGQSFTDNKYFWGRPSAVGYNAAGSGGSNKAASDSSYQKLLEQRITDFLARNPSVKREDIPSDMITASGSGLDPDISPASARIQVSRVAAARHLPQQVVLTIVEQHTEKPLAGLFGPQRVNVLALNAALDEYK